MTFDWSITLGAVLQIVTMVASVFALALALKARLDSLEDVLKTHAAALEKHDNVLTLYESRFFTMVADVQKLIGKFEVLASREWSSSKES